MGGRGRQHGAPLPLAAQCGLVYSSGSTGMAALEVCMSTTPRFGLLQAAIVLAAAATALIHIGLAFQFPGGIDPVFLLNGAGYLGLTALLFLPLPALDPYRGIVRWLLIAYTLVTILAWLLIGARSPIAYADKALELLLVVLLWLDWQRARARLH